MDNIGPTPRPRGPAFLGIGAARCATTWLAESLGRCDEIWIPRRKELHYFTRGSRYASPSRLREPDPLRRLLGRGRHNAEFRRELTRTFGRHLREPSLGRLGWDLRYLLGVYGDDWYRSLFPRARVGGEITPAYSLLDDGDIAGLTALLPDVRIVYLIRDPIDRAWSTLRYHARRGGPPVAGASDAELYARLMAPGLVHRSQYAEVVRRWRRHVPAERFLVVCYDEIVAAPAAALTRVLGFLGLGDAGARAADLCAGRVNASSAASLPPAIERALARQYAPMLEDLAGLVDCACVHGWLDRARTAAGRTGRPRAGSSNSFTSRPRARPNAEVVTL